MQPRKRASAAKHEYVDSQSDHRAQVDLLQVDLVRHDHHVVLALAGELDLASADHLREAFQRVSRPAPEHVLLDLAQLEFMDASGLHVIYEAARGLGERLSVRPGSHRPLFRLGELDGELRFVGPQAESAEHQLAVRNIGYVRALYSVWQAEGLGAMAQLVPDDVVWHPSGADGRTLRGTDELLAFRARSDPPPIAAAAWFTAVGEDVIAESDHRLGGGAVKRIYSLFEFNHRRLVKATAVAGGRD